MGHGLGNRNAYTRTGLSLLVAGTLLFLAALFIFRITWLTALGTCLLILAFILLMLGRSIPRLSPEVSSLLLKTGLDNIGTIIEELGLKNKAVYLPASLTGGQPRALIPLHANPSLPPLTKLLPNRLIIRYGTAPDDIGLLLSTIGGAAASLLKVKLTPHPAELESALTSLLRGTLGVADGARVTQQENRLRVEIHNPQIENNSGWSHQCLGSPLASIAAAVAAEAWNGPVTVKQEEHLKGKCCVELEVLR